MVNEHSRIFVIILKMARNRVKLICFLVQSQLNHLRQGIIRTTSSDTVEYIAPTDDFNHGSVSELNDNSTMAMDIFVATIGEDVQDATYVSDAETQIYELISHVAI